MKIYVTLGSFKKFDRLLKAVDLIISKKHEFVIQTGETDYVFKNLNNNVYTQEYFSEIEHLSNIKKADLVITHIGIGTIIDLLQYNKKVIFFPRLYRFNEVANKHQEDMTKELRKLGNKVVLRSCDLNIKKAKPIKFFVPETETFKKELLNFIKK